MARQTGPRRRRSGDEVFDRRGRGGRPWRHAERRSSAATAEGRDGSVPIDDVRSLLETGEFRGKATDPLHAMIRKGMVVSDEGRRTKVQAYADAFVTTRTASKDAFPMKPDKFKKLPGELPKIVSLEEALKRAKPRSAKKGSRKRTAAAKAKSAAKKKKPAAAPPARKPPARAAKEPYSPSFP